MLGTIYQINSMKNNIIDIGDLKNYIVKTEKKYLIENLKISYNNNNKETILTKDIDKVNIPKDIPGTIKQIKETLEKLLKLAITSQKQNKRISKLNYLLKTMKLKNVII